MNEASTEAKQVCIETGNCHKITMWPWILVRDSLWGRETTAEAYYSTDSRDSNGSAWPNAQQPYKRVSLTSPLTRLWRQTRQLTRLTKLNATSGWWEDLYSHVSQKGSRLLRRREARIDCERVRYPKPQLLTAISSSMSVTSDALLRTLSMRENSRFIFRTNIQSNRLCCVVSNTRAKLLLFMHSF